MSLETNIKEWVNLDNRYKKLSDEIKEVRDKKSELSDFIFNYCNDRKINPTINISDGTLKLIDIQQSNSLTYKFLLDCFYKFYESKEEEADKLLEFIKNQRTYSRFQTIKRIYK